jgi:cysteine synthase
LPNGSLDPNFGGGGTANTTIAGFQARNRSVTAVIVDPRNGRILLGAFASACTRCVSDTVLIPGSHQIRQAGRRVLLHRSPVTDL